MVGGTISDSISSGLIYGSGTYTIIDSPTTGGSIYFSDINNSGQIVGNDGKQGFVYINNAFIPLNTPNSFTTRTFSIANNGLVLGSFVDATGNHGFIYNGSTYQKLQDPPNSYDGYAASFDGINNSGVVVGSLIKPIPGTDIGYGPIFESYGYLLQNGKYEIIDTGVPITKSIGNGHGDISVNSTQAKGISDDGLVVGAGGCLNITKIYGCSFIYNGNTLETLDWPVLNPNSITNSPYVPIGWYPEPLDELISGNGLVFATVIQADGMHFYLATPKTPNSPCHPNVIYNLWSHELTVQDVLVAGVHYYAKLSDQGNYNFKLIESHPVAAGTCPVSDVIQYANNSVTIPSVLAYGNDYNLTLVLNNNTGLYTMTNYRINAVTQ